MTTVRNTLCQPPPPCLNLNLCIISGYFSESLIISYLDLRDNEISQIDPWAFPPGLTNILLGGNNLQVSMCKVSYLYHHLGVVLPSCWNATLNMT